MASEKKSGSDSKVEVEDVKVDLATKIPAGINHMICREALANPGAFVNIGNAEGDTPLMYAVKDNHVMCVNELIKAGASVNISNQSNDTPHLAAAESGYRKLVERLLEAGADVNHYNRSCYTALIYAARRGNIKMLDTLLKAGADVNMKNNKGEDALYQAAFSVNYKAIELLLEAGADVNSRTTEGLFPLIAVVSVEHDGFNGRMRCVKLLINAGANVNAETADGVTALIPVAECGFAKCMKLLIQAGADVNKGRRKDSSTALICALREQCFGDCVDMLLKAGADVNVTDNDGSTALHLHTPEFYLGIQNCSQEKKLLRVGIHINRFNRSRGENALGSHLGKTSNTDPLMLLYAAGETLDGTAEDKIPEELKFEEEKLELKHICREAIRKHLLKLDPHQHLFSRIPQLGLPSIVSEYLLFNQSLDDDDDSDDDNDDADWSLD